MHISYIALGANLGDRAATIERAVALLGRHDHVRIISQSPIYEFAAVTRDGMPQPAYLNGVVAVETSLAPLELLGFMQSIEATLGRPAEHGIWQPRVIDLDMLLYDDLVFVTPTLAIPHPAMTKRMFVLRPLCDIAAGLKHPATKKTIREYVQDIADHRAGPHCMADLKESEGSD